jgi:diaminopimelate epimerase
MIINFTKMHGIGNDFILIDCLQHSFGLDRSTFGESAKKLCDRRFGVGADQILILQRSEPADFKMLIFNADGSEVEMCGNGIRCLAKYVWDRKLSGKNVLAIETLAGIIKPEKAGEMVKVDMGEPIFEPEKIPVKIQNSDIRPQTPPHPPLVKGGMGGIVDYPLQIADKEFKVTCISMGNPHAVIVVDDVAKFPVTYYGPMIEAHAIFPGKSNVEFIEIISGKEIKMRVWERGSGETMACGTGACAAAVASNIKGLTGGNVTIHLLGGDLLIERASDNHVYMTGPAVEVFEGIIRQ